MDDDGSSPSSDSSFAAVPGLPPKQDSVSGLIVVRVHSAAPDLHRWCEWSKPPLLQGGITAGSNPARCTASIPQVAEERLGTASIAVRNRFGAPYSRRPTLGRTPDEGVTLVELQSGVPNLRE